MDKVQESTAGMFLKTANFFIKNGVKIGTIPALPPLFATHQVNVNDLFNADTGARADLRGYTMDKGIKRTNLETIALKISNAVSAVAALASNNALLKRADFSSSFWYSCSEEELITQATIVRDLAIPIIASLLPFGVAPADLASHTTALNSFVLAVSDPSLVADVRKEDNNRMDDIIDRARLHLDTKLDIVMRVFESTDPVFYKLYNDARAIDTNGSAQAPTAIVQIDANSLRNINTQTKYNPDLLYTFQNTSATADIDVSLSAAADTEGDIVITIPKGQTRQRMAKNLSSNGVFLMANNHTPDLGELKIWIE
jgi:hypothetical protein